MTVYNARTTPVDTTFLDRKVRIVTPFPSLSAQEIEEITGRTGTVKWDTPDSDGDLYVEFDVPVERNGRTSTYVREWEFIDEAAHSSEPGVVEPTLTDAEERLEALIDEIYKVAEQRGYQGLLRGVMEAADIPMRPAKRTLTIRGHRIVSVSDRTPVDAALRAVRLGEQEAEVSVNRVLVEFNVKVPFPHPEGMAQDPCHQVANDLSTDNWAAIPDEVLINAGRAVGLSANAAALRTWLTRTVEKDMGHAPIVHCTYC